MSSSVVSWLVKPDYVSVNLMSEGSIRPFQLHSTHPTFKKLVRAIKAKNFKAVPKLVSVAEEIANVSHGNVTVKKGAVYYKGQVVDNSITKKIFELIQHRLPVAYLLQFMDNLYKQPDAQTVNEVYEWLANGRFALTTDGCFLAYKRVRSDYKDFYTGTINHTPGQVVMMPRKDVDPNRRNECSYGLHFASTRYLPHYHGGSGKIVEVKINPADVVAIPEGYGYSKGRTWRYEVIRTIGEEEFIEGQTDTPVMLRPIVRMPEDRIGLIHDLLKMPSVKRLLRRGKMTKESFTKASTDRLQGWHRKFTAIDFAPEKSKLFDNPLRFTREAAGLTLGQIAKELGLDLKKVQKAEMASAPEQELVDQYLAAVEKLQGNVHRVRTGVAYPNATVPQPEFQPEDGVGDEDEYEDDDYDDYED